MAILCTFCQSDSVGVIRLCWFYSAIENQRIQRIPNDNQSSSSALVHLQKDLMNS